MLEAKSSLSRLVEAAERGEQVFLKRNGIVVAQIVPAPKNTFPFGFMREEVETIEDDLLFSSLEEEFTQL